MAQTLQQLKERIERLIDEQGADAPVAAFLYTKNDVVDFDEDGNEVPITDEDDVDEVLFNIEDNDWIYEQIFNCIEDEVKELKNNKNT